MIEARLKVPSTASTETAVVDMTDTHVLVRVKVDDACHAPLPRSRIPPPR